MAAWAAKLMVMAATVFSVGCVPQQADKPAALPTTPATGSPAPTPGKPSDPPPPGESTTGRPGSKPVEQPSGPPPVVRLTVGRTPNYVNVMGKEMPPIPEFPALEKKPGVLRGHVKDSSGRPLQGAVIGVRSTAIGGVYSGASGESDEKGYYEVKVPQGAAHFYAAGYTVDYADGRAALSLHPADGKLDSFASANGSVENFVLLTYGIADRDRLSENPGLRSNFYGGSINVGHFTSEPEDAKFFPTNLPTGTEVEITLTPEGRLLDGSVGKTFVVRKAVFGSSFNINNIPVGQYRITAKRANGQPLFLKLNRPKDLPFGITPAETTEGALLTLYPAGAKAGQTLPKYGSWNAVELYVEIPKAK